MMNKKHLGNLCSILLAVFTVAPIAGEERDWPRWRGPASNGLADRSPPLINSLRGQQPVWQSESILSGDRGGRGSLAIAGGRLYLLSGRVENDLVRDELVCLDAQSGDLLWRAQLSEQAYPESGSSTPCVWSGRVYVPGSGSEVFCIDAETGDPVWRRALERSSPKPVSSSISVVDGVAVLVADTLTGLDAATGDILWTQPEITGLESSATLWHSPDGYRILCNTDRETHCLLPGTGDRAWSVDGGGRSTPVVAREYGGDFLINMSDDRRNGLSAYRLGAGAPELLWTHPFRDRAASPVLFDGHVYAVAGGGNGHQAQLVCVHVDSGQIAWQEIVPFAEVSSPAVADGKLWAICGTFLWLIQATPERCNILGQENYQVALCTSPAVVEGRVYLRLTNSVACFDVRRAP